MSCELSEKVSLLVDGELPPAETRAVIQHLATCGACQQLRADFLGMRQQISAYTVVRAPQAERRALAAILAQSGATNGAGRWRERLTGLFALPRFNPAFATVAALLVVACVVGLFVYRNANRRTAVAYNAPPNSNQPEQTTGKSAPATSATPGPRETIAQKENNQPGTTSGAATGKRQLAVNNLASVNQNRRPVTVGGSRLPQSARNKLPRVPSAPGRVPQFEQREPSFVAANATAPTIAPTITRVRPADAETLTMRHVEQAELLLRTFRNARAGTGGAAGDLSHEKGRAQQLLYQNIVLRREATGAGNVQVASLLDSLEPILLDIANLPADASAADVRAISARVQRKNLVALLQINSTALARAYE